MIKKVLHRTIEWLCACTLLACVSGGSTQINSQSSRDTIERARAHTELGAVYYQQNKMEIALDEFNEALEANPNYALAHNGLGMVYAGLREDVKAESHFKRSVQIDPNSSESHNNYGNFLCARGRIDESIMHFLEAVKNPLYATSQLAYANAGVCALKKKDEKNAEMYFIKALQIDPLYHRAAYQLAQLQFNQGQALRARETLQLALYQQATPEVLWLGIQIERKLGNKDAEASYSLDLRKRFSDSPQAKLLMNGQ